MTNLMVTLTLVAAVSGLLGFTGAAGGLTWPVLGVFWISLLFLMVTALVVVAGGQGMFR